MSGLSGGFVKCERPGLGWECLRAEGHEGLCNAKARWWNLRARAWYWLNGL